MDQTLARGFMVGDVKVEPARSCLSGAAGERHIEPRAMDVLVCLARHGGEVVSREELIRQVWAHPHVSDETLSRCISILRRALGDSPAAPRVIETIPKRGYRLVPPVVPIARAHASADKPTSVVVLPFLDLSADPSHEHLADGMTELLISSLACLPALRVISRTSSMRYRGSRARLAEIARELDVDCVIEGSVLTSAHSVQVVVQIIDPATDLHLFARTYTRELGDLLRLQNDMAWVLAQEISEGLQPVDRDRLPPARSYNVDAMQSFLRARHFWAQRTPEGFRKAIREYEECLHVEPEFAPALAGFSMTLATMALYGVAPPSGLLERARGFARQAILLDGTGAEALTACGGVSLFFGWDRQEAEGLFRRALAANPSYDIARLGLADVLLFGNDHDSAMHELFQAVRVNPFDLGLQMNVGQFLGFARRYPDAVDQLRRTVDMGPHFWPARCLLAETLALAGDAAGARAQLQEAGKDIPVARLHQPRAIVHALLGERGTALELLAQMEADRAVGYLPAWEFARVHAMLGEAGEAMRWLDLGIEERSPLMLTLGIAPAFDSIRTDPGFRERLGRVGLPVH